MALTGFPVAANDDLSSLSKPGLKLIELWHMFRERKAVLSKTTGENAVTFPKDGDPAANLSGPYTSLAAIQHWIELYCTNFVRSVDEDSEYVDGLVTMYTMETLCEDAGIPYETDGGFRCWSRRYGDITVGLTTDVGNVAAGDVVTPEVYNEIRQALAKLKKTTAALTWGGEGSGYFLNGYGSDPDWAAAKAEAEASRTTSNPAGGPPICYTNGGTAYSTELQRSWAAGIVEGLLRPVAVQIDFYNYGSLPIGGTIPVFDANGDNVANGQWCKHDTSSELGLGFDADGADMASAVIGAEAVPAWCDIPLPDNPTSRGYTVLHGKAVMTWTFTYE